MQPPQRSPFKGGAGEGVIVSQIGWAPASQASSNVLTVVPAGHAAGIYEVGSVVIVRTTVSSTMSGALAWTSPTFGAESNSSGFGVISTNILGTGLIVSGTSSVGMRSPATIHSTGATAITATFTIGTHAGAPVIDVYVYGRLVAA